MTRIIRTLAAPVIELGHAGLSLGAAMKKHWIISSVVLAIIITLVVLACKLKGRVMERFRHKVSQDTARINAWFRENRIAIGVFSGVVYLVAVVILLYRDIHTRINAKNKICDKNMDFVHSSDKKFLQKQNRALRKEVELIRGNWEQAAKENAELRGQLLGNILQDPSRMVVASEWITDPANGGAKYCNVMIYKKNEDGSIHSLEQVYPIWRAQS